MDSVTLESVCSVRTQAERMAFSKNQRVAAFADPLPQLGHIRKCDMASIYTYQNTLYKLQMTGEQLRRFMEWSAAFFKTWKPDEVHMYSALNRTAAE